MVGLGIGYAYMQLASISKGRFLVKWGQTYFPVKVGITREVLYFHLSAMHMSKLSSHM